MVGLKVKVACDEPDCSETCDAISWPAPLATKLPARWKAVVTPEGPLVYCPVHAGDKSDSKLVTL